MATYVIALGSNLGDRLLELRLAAEIIQNISGKAVKKSAIYETEPLGPGTQWYFNACIEASIELPPEVLLSELKSWETRRGRDPGAPRWTDRVIDLDIVAAGELSWRSAMLEIPHPSMALRRFVLQPLAEIHPGWFHPIWLKTVEELLEAAPVLRMQKNLSKW